jgi:hypothetical protein
LFKFSKNVKTIEVFNLMGEILSQGTYKEINLNAFPSGMLPLGEKAETYFAQAPNWAWAKGGGGSTNELPRVLY